MNIVKLEKEQKGNLCDSCRNILIKRKKHRFKIQIRSTVTLISDLQNLYLTRLIIQDSPSFKKLIEKEVEGGEEKGKRERERERKS